mgnify:CR=1 FL=1
MNKRISLKSIVNILSNEKGLSEELIFNAISEAILHATRKKYTMLNIDICIDKNNGTYKTYALYNVIMNSKYDTSIKNSFKSIPVKQAKVYDPTVQPGDIIKREIQSINFGRIDAQIARQMITQKVKNAEKKTSIKELEKKIGCILIGMVKKITKDILIIDLSNGVEGVIKKKNLIPKDSFKIGDKIKVYFYKIYKDKNNTELQFSRICNEMLLSLLKTEVPEINEGLVEIIDIARDPGLKAKISIKAKNPRIDPIGACIGVRGSRIQAISKELKGERIDIVLWDYDIKKYIANIFSPITIEFLDVDYKKNCMTLSVKKEYLSKIIGKNGRNIKLINKLVKWDINIQTYDNK